MHKVIQISVLLLLLLSCSKDNNVDCKLWSGSIITESRNVAGFRNILIEDNINVIFHETDTSIIEIEAGSALIDNIVTEVTDEGWLILRNENGCDWARDYNLPVNVYIKNTDIDTLNYRSIGTVKSIDTLFTEKLIILATEGAGNIEPAINVEELICELHYGTLDIILSGICNFAYVYSASYGLVDLRDLQTNTIFVNSISTNDTYVNSMERIGVQIYGLGNIYYTGNPSIVESSIYGSGELIKLP